MNGLTEQIIGAAIEVHRHLGPGLLESAYEACLAYELEQLGLAFERQKGLPLIYKEIHLDQGYRIDLLVEQKVVVEIKAVEHLTPVHEAQVLSYLRFSGCPIGLLLNLGQAAQRRYPAPDKNLMSFPHPFSACLCVYSLWPLCNSLCDKDTIR